MGLKYFNFLYFKVIKILLELTSYTINYKNLNYIKLTYLVEVIGRYFYSNYYLYNCEVTGLKSFSSPVKTI